MKTVMNNIIEKVIDETVNGFIDVVSNKFGINREELRRIWTDGYQPPKAPTREDERPPVVVLEPKSVVREEVREAQKPAEQSVDGNKKKRKNAVSDIIACQYVILRGSKKGEMCGCAIRKKGNDFCSKHNSEEGEEKKVKQTKLSAPLDLSNKVVLRRNKTIDKLWHEDSGMVFESISNRVVIGRCEGEEIKPLTAGDVAVCKELNFAIKDVDPVAVAAPVQVPKQKEEAKHEDKDGDTIKYVENLLNSLQESPKKKPRDDSETDSSDSDSSDSDSDSDSDLEEEE